MATDMSAGPNGDFAGKYGPWALILGASEGIGASFARELARRGLDLVLVARREAPLRGLAEEIIDATARKVVAVQVQVDLTSDAAVAQVQSKVDRREIGLMIFNAGAVPCLTEFADLAPGRVLECTRLNVMGQTTFAAAFVPLMRACGRGG
jgi:short-subunit dehydrogenase